MESEGEQTATIEAEITIGATTYSVFVTHLDNFIDPAIDESQIIQQRQILERIFGKSNVILMGDFNFDNSTQQYIETIAVLDDCWEIANYTFEIIDVPNDWETRLPDERIDHIFISPDLSYSYIEVTYFGGTASDHPAVLTSIAI